MRAKKPLLEEDVNRTPGLDTGLRISVYYLALINGAPAPASRPSTGLCPPGDDALFFDETGSIASPGQFAQLACAELDRRPGSHRGPGHELEYSFFDSPYYGEFDPGSGRTLAAGLTHASRTQAVLRDCLSGARVRNA